MPYDVIDLVDFSAQKEIDKLEAAFKDLADIRAQDLLSREEDRIGAEYSHQRAAGANQ